MLVGGICVLFCVVEFDLVVWWVIFGVWFFVVWRDVCFGKIVS